MMFTRSTLVALVATAGLASALPSNATYGPLDVRRSHANRAAHLAKRFSNARATWYDVGLGACGERNVPSDFIVALNDKQYGSGYPGPHCFEKITIRYKGKSAVATIMDMCPGCPFGALDMSKSLFTHFEPLGTGVFYMEWEFGGNGGGGGGGGNNNDDDDDNNNRNDDKDEEEDERTTERRDPPRTSTRRTRTTTRTTSRASRTSRSSTSREATSTSASNTVIAIAAGPTTSRRPKAGNIGQQQQLIANLGLMASFGRSSDSN